MTGVVKILSSYLLHAINKIYLPKKGKSLTLEILTPDLDHTPRIYMQVYDTSLEVFFRNEILTAGETGKTLNAEAILISEFTNSQIRITATFGVFCQTDRLPGCQHFILKNLYCLSTGITTRQVGQTSLACFKKETKQKMSLYLIERQFDNI